MQKLVAILYSVIILFQSLNLSIDDISKLNVLLEHAKYHQETYGDSFFEFIAEHYSDLDSHVDAEHEEHKDLPFKHSQQNCSQLNWVFVMNTFSFTVQHRDSQAIPLNFYYTESHSLFEKSSVFQPPKLA